MASLVFLAGKLVRHRQGEADENTNMSSSFSVYFFHLSK
jgi:hypothetical protein